MNRTEFMSTLHRYIAQPPNWGKSGCARELLEYIDRLELQGDEMNRCWTESYLPQIILGMVYDQRRRRNAELPYKAKLLDAPDSYEAFHRESERNDIASVILDITGSEVVPEIVDKLLRADHHAITAKFVQFAQEAYDRGGLRKKIILTVTRDRRPMMSGMFGTTQLTSFVSGGRVLLTLSRKTAEGYDIGIVSFVVDEDDHLGITGGLHGLYADIPTAYSMFDDVINGWVKQPESLKASTAFVSGR